MISVLNHLPSRQDMLGRISKHFGLPSSALRIDHWPRRDLSPDSFVALVVAPTARYWVKLTPRHKTNEAALCRALQFGPVPVPRVLLTWETEYIRGTILADRPGVALDTDPNAARHLPAAGAALARLHAYWCDNEAILANVHDAFPPHAELFHGLNPAAHLRLAAAIEILEAVPQIVTHGDALPYNWIVGCDGSIGPLDFGEAKIAYCLLDVVQLLHRTYWTERDPGGHFRRLAVDEYGRVFRDLGLPAPWIGAERVYCQAASIVDQARWLNWLYRMRLAWCNCGDQRMLPDFRADPEEILIAKSQLILGMLC